MLVSQRFLWAIAGISLGVPFVYSTLWPTSIFGLWVLFVVIDNARTKTELVLGGLTAGLLMNLCVVSWHWSTYPLEGINAESLLIQFSIIGLYWFLTGIVLSPGVILFSLTAKIIITRSLWFIVLTPLLWVCSELYGIFLFSVGSFGDGGVVGFDFGFGHIGNVVVGEPFFLLFGSVLGVYSISFAVVFCSSVSFVLWKESMARGLLLFLFFLCVTIFFSTGFESPQVLGMRVLVVETHFDKIFFHNPNSYEIKSASVREAVGAAVKENADVIILPEDSRFTENFDDSEEVFAFLAESNRNFGGVLIDSGRTINKQAQTVMRAHVYDVSAHVVTYTDKQYLVPQGEFIPYLFAPLLPRVFSPNVWDALRERLSYRRGGNGTIALSNPYVPALLFCSESVSPYGVKKALNKHLSSFVAHPISHAWFEEPQVMWKQLDSMLRIQAFWNRTPIVSAANMAESKIYTATGEIKKGVVIAEDTYWKIKRFDF